MPELIDRFNRVSRRYLEKLPPNTCIEQTRIVTECLRAFGAVVTPIETSLYVYCDELKVLYLSGADDEVARLKSQSKNVVQRYAANGDGGERLPGAYVVQREPVIGSFGEIVDDPVEMEMERVERPSNIRLFR